MDAQAEITRDVRIEAARLKLELDKKLHRPTSQLAQRLAAEKTVTSGARANSPTNPNTSFPTQIQVQRSAPTAQGFFTTRRSYDVNPSITADIAAGEQTKEFFKCRHDRREVSLAHCGPVVVVHQRIDRPVFSVLGSYHLDPYGIEFRYLSLHSIVVPRVG